MVNGFINWLLKKQLIRQEDTELYRYACVSFTLMIAPFLIAAVIGAIYGKTLSGIITVLPFVFMRKFTGGFHFHDLKVCLISSILILWICLKLAWNIDCVEMLIVIAVLAIVIIMIFGPVENENKLLSKQEKNKYRKTSFIIGCLFLAFDIISYMLGNNELAICVSIGIILTLVLYIAGMVNSMVHKSQNYMPL